MFCDYRWETLQLKLQKKCGMLLNPKNQKLWMQSLKVCCWPLVLAFLIEMSHVVFLANFVSFPGKLEEAIDHITEAITLNPTSAILYATRGSFLFLRKFMLSDSKFNFQFSFNAWPYHVHQSLSVLRYFFLGSVFVKLKKPHAAIRDADAALAVSVAESPLQLILYSQQQKF